MNSRSRYYLALKDAETRIASLRKLHHRIEIQGSACCSLCYFPANGSPAWPCPTITILDAPLN